MPTDYLIFSAVSPQASSPVVLCVTGLTPPDAPTSGLAQSEYISGSLEQAWTLLPVFQSDWYVLQHKLTGLALKFGAEDAQLTVEPYEPFDRSFFVTFNNNSDNVQIYNVAQPALMVTVAGSNYTPPAPVNGSGDNAAQGQRWLLVPFAPSSNMALRRAGGVSKGGRGARGSKPAKQTKAGLSKGKRRR